MRTNIPKSKFQISNSNGAPGKPLTTGLEIGIWNLFGVWILGFGIFLLA